MRRNWELCKCLSVKHFKHLFKMVSLLRYWLMLLILSARESYSTSHYYLWSCSQAGLRVQASASGRDTLSWSLLGISVTDGLEGHIQGIFIQFPHPTIDISEYWVSKTSYFFKFHHELLDLLFLKYIVFVNFLYIE